MYEHMLRNLCIIMYQTSRKQEETENYSLSEKFAVALFAFLCLFQFFFIDILHSFHKLDGQKIKQKYKFHCHI